ncbi:MAG TPA: glycosyltransferase family 4 protein [Bryobacteraceae bacterium]|nr:glycosyltransferase family 4 protein [Bryobacteraceae bacterium]
MGQSSKNLRVLYLITKSEAGGAQSHVLSLLRDLRSEFDFALGVGEEGQLSERARELGISVFRLRYLVHRPDPLRDPLAVGEVLGLIRRWQPTLLHAHTAKAGLVGRAAARLAGIRSVYTPHGWAFSERAGRLQRVAAIRCERWLSNWDAEIITVSGAERAVAERAGLSMNGHCHVIHNGVPDTPHRAGPRSYESGVMIHVGRFVAEKDHDLLLRSLSQLRCRYRLVLVGDGPLRSRVEAQAVALGLSRNIDFLGTRDDIAELLSQASLFVLPSKWEAFPISVLEAMRGGLAVVATNVGGLAEAVDDGETGFLVPRGDAVSLAQRLSRLLESPASAATMGVQGRARYERLFTADLMLNRTLEIYRRALMG